MTPGSGVTLRWLSRGSCSGGVPSMRTGIASLAAVRSMVGNQVEVVLGRPDRRHEHVHAPVPRLDTERRADHAGGRFRRAAAAACDDAARPSAVPRASRADRELDGQLAAGRGARTDRSRGSRRDRLSAPPTAASRAAAGSRSAESPGIRKRCSDRRNQRSARPALRASGPAPHRQHVADDAVETLLEDAREARAILFVLQLRLQRVDVDRQPPLGHEVVPDVLVRRDDVIAVHRQRVGQRTDESAGLGVAMAVVDGLVGDEAVVSPHRNAVSPPPAAERPARQRLARIPLALAEVQQRARRESLLQTPDERAGQMTLGGAERREVPLGAVHVVDRDKRRLPSHRQAHVVRGELGVDVAAQSVDLPPLVVGVRLGDARRLVDSAHAHLVAERHLAFVDRAGHRRRALRIRRGRERDVAFAGHEPERGVEPDPARTRQVDLGPRVQVGEVDIRAAGAVERLHVRLELNEVAGHEPRRETEMAEDLHEQPRAVAARAGARA